MSKQRYINTKFWSDNYINNLDPIERYLFLYFLTNEHTDICGIYEVPMRILAFETGIEQEMLAKILKRFEADDKIIYRNGWVAIKNFAKHQKNNPKVQKGIEIGLQKAPLELQKWIDKDSLSIGYDSLSHLNSNSNLNPNLNSNPNLNLESVVATDVATPSQEAKKFFSLEESRQTVIDHLTKQGLPLDVLKGEVKKFVLYWTEPNSTGKKQRWQTEKTFEIRRRLATWLSRANMKAKNINIPSL